MRVVLQRVDRASCTVDGKITGKKAGTTTVVVSASYKNVSLQEEVTVTVCKNVYSLIYAGENTRVMYDSIVDKDKAIELLNKLSPTGVTVDYKGAISYVQEKFNENKSLVTYLVTDREYNSDNINVINVSNDDNNFAIVDLSYNNTNDLKINGKVISYKESASIYVEIYVDDTLVTTEKVIVSKN